MWVISFRILEIFSTYVSNLAAQAFDGPEEKAYECITGGGQRASTHDGAPFKE